MIKNIILNDQPVEINTAMGWLFRYRETFGNDILPDLLPLLESLVLAATDFLEDSEDGPTLSGLLAGIREGRFIQALAMLGGLETITILQIIWSMQKEANEETPGFREWTKQTDTCYLDEIIPELFWAICDTLVSKKKMERLRNAAGKLKTKPDAKTTISPSTPSSSEQSVED